MRPLPDISISVDSVGQRGVADGMGDVRVFWIAAAIAVAAVVMVVAFKLEGRDLRTTLFTNFPGWAQQMVAPAVPAGGASGQNVALKSDSHGLVHVSR